MRPENKARYDKLVTQAKGSYQSSDSDLSWWDDCQEINLWTYWQGRNCQNVRIMLVGQDWGCPWDSASHAVIENVRQINCGHSISYMDKNDNETDKNLIRLFDSIGYDVSATGTQYNDLFFTNLVMGYRKKGSSGNFKSAWAKHDAPYFKSLVQLLEPEYLFCLGRDTFQGVLDALGAPTPAIPHYNQFIRSEHNPISAALRPGHCVKVCALAHCGKLGTWNRNRKHDAAGGITTNSDLEAQIKDWKWVLRKDTGEDPSDPLGRSVAEKIRALYQISKDLESLFPGRHYTPDGHMVGSIGEALAAHYYALELFPASEKTHDARAKDGRLVQIKATQTNRVALTSLPEWLLVLKIHSDGSFTEAYNGPGDIVWKSCGGLQKNGQRSISLHKLELLQGRVSLEARLTRFA